MPKKNEGAAKFNSKKLEILIQYDCGKQNCVHFLKNSAYKLALFLFSIFIYKEPDRIEILGPIAMPANVVDSLIVDHKRAVRVFQGCVRSQNWIIRLNNCSADLWSRVDAKF